MRCTDQLGRTVEVSGPPARIVSVVPSQTELLFDLGVGDRVVGVTKFCVHPDHARATRDRIGGTKKLKLEKIAALLPDLILANREENRRDEIEWLAERFPVWVSDIASLDQSLEMIKAVGDICAVQSRAEALCEEIRLGFSGLEPVAPLRTVYLIWWEPLMAAASNTFIGDLLRRCGFVSPLSATARYPELRDSELQGLDPELILLSSEPFPFREKHREQLAVLCPEAQIAFVDGEMFSWYGSRLELSAQYLQVFCNSLRGGHGAEPAREK